MVCDEADCVAIGGREGARWELLAGEGVAGFAMNQEAIFSRREVFFIDEDEPREEGGVCTLNGSYTGLSYRRGYVFDGQEGKIFEFGDYLLVQGAGVGLLKRTLKGGPGLDFIMTVHFRATSPNFYLAVTNRSGARQYA